MIASPLSAPTSPMLSMSVPPAPRAPRPAARPGCSALGDGGVIALTALELALQASRLPARVNCGLALQRTARWRRWPPPPPRLSPQPAPEFLAGLFARASYSSLAFSSAETFSDLPFFFLQAGDGLFRGGDRRFAVQGDRAMASISSWRPSPPRYFRSAESKNHVSASSSATIRFIRCTLFL